MSSRAEGVEGKLHLSHLNEQLTRTEKESLSTTEGQQCVRYVGCDALAVRLSTVLGGAGIEERE